MMRFVQSTLVVTLVLAMSGCLGSGEEGPSGRLEVSVAPLSLSGITNAQYTIAVRNAPGGLGQVVWTRTVTSDQYGDGAGDITYVGPCDASAGTHTVTLTLDALMDTNGTVAPASYVNPTPVSLERECVPNADVPVVFDITLMRRADQGFFDVSVQFEDIFCSAKLDCQGAGTNDLELLFNGAERDMTAVLGFACKAGASAAETFLYMDDLVIDCTGAELDVRVAPTGEGLVTPSANPNGYLFGAAIYRGVEASGVMYWNAALGLDQTKFAQMGNCTLKTRATASRAPWPQLPAGFPLPPATVYPVIVWEVQLTSATGRTCTKHEVNADNGVATEYLGYLPLANGFTWANGPIHMQHRLEETLAGTQVLSAGAPVCNPACAHGGCVDLGAGPVCDCAGTGWTGPTCATPTCASACDNGGDCVAPNTCDCAGTGFDGPTCAQDVDECATANGGCDAVATCTNEVGGRSCECPAGFFGDGLTCSPCASGAVQPASGAASCEACPAGTFDDGTEVCASCASCASGTYEQTACMADSNRICAPCATISGCVGSVTCAGPGDSVCSQCPSGYVQPSPGAPCTDIDECAAHTDTCHVNATCTNTAGGFTCACVGGAAYGDGQNCGYPTSCLAARQAGITTSGSRYIDADGLGGAAPQQVVCDMATDGGGYTYFKVSVGSAYSAAQAEQHCEDLGMQLFIPRTAAHLTAAWQIATHPNVGPSGSDAYLRLLGIYPKFANATCANMALHSGNAACNWQAGDLGQFWVSTRTDIAEPNGPNGNVSLIASMSYTYDGSGNASGWSDLAWPGHTSTEFMCDVGDKVGQPRSCKDYRQLGHTASGSYVIDTDGNGPKAPVTIYCDMQTDGGGWTLVQNSTFATFDNTPFVGTANVCASIAGCTTNGTSNIFAPSQVADYLFVCDFDGDIANPHVSASMYSPANYNRGQGAVMTLYQTFTDTRRGTTAVGETVGVTNAIYYGAAGGRDNVSNQASSIGWYEGNYHDIANQESFQLNGVGANWGHHHFTFPNITASWPSTNYHYSYLCGSKASNSAWTDTEKANARWLVFVR